MSFPATPESQDYMFQPQHVVNSAYTVRDWNALDVHILIRLPSPSLHGLMYENRTSTTGNVIKQITQHQIV